MSKTTESEIALVEFMEVSDSAKLPIKPFVSIIVLAYNHGLYISEAIDSILSQQVDFNFEIIIGEDCSTDNTREIVFDYQKRFPHLIRVLFSESNVGMNKNLLRLLTCSHGDFVAVCEGDDFWSHPEKLAMQISAFESRDELRLLFTDRVVLVNGVSSISRYSHRDYSLADVLAGFIPPTQTMMWRNDSELQLLIFAHPYNRSGDRLIAYFCAQRGVIGHLGVVTATYRMSGSGVWSSTHISARRRLKYQHLKDFHRMLEIDGKGFLMKCAKDLLLDAFFDIKRARGGFSSNMVDIFYFSRIFGFLKSIGAVVKKTVKMGVE